MGMCNPSLLHAFIVHAEIMQRIEQHNSLCISTDWGAMWEFRPQLCIDVVGLVIFRSLIGFHAADHLLYYHPNVK